jgi:hypothetical protein
MDANTFYGEIMVRAIEARRRAMEQLAANSRAAGHTEIAIICERRLAEMQKGNR